MDLTVAIVSYNAREALEACLSSVFASSIAPQLEVIVVDNASSDESVPMMRTSFPRATLVESSDNVGFARACNLAWRRAQSELVVFLNSDTTVSESALARLVEIMNAQPDIGILGPLLRNTDGSVQMSFGNMMSFTAELRQKIVDAGYRDGRGPLRGYVERQHATAGDVDWVSGACLVTRRELLERSGGFDEGFFLYSEDVDLCARMRADGCRVVFTPEVAITHLRGGSVSEDRERAWVESQRSRLRFYRKHYGEPRLSLLKLYLTTKLVLSYLVRPSARPAYRTILKLVLRGDNA